MKQATIFVVIISFFFTHSCSSDDNYTIVDFSNTVVTSKPTQETNRKKQLRVAVAAMISPKETFVYYKELLGFLGSQLDRDIVLVQRKTYKEINELFSENGVDLAFICSGPYALKKDQFKFQAIATPVVRGSPFYQSYLIVNKKSRFQSLSELRQHTFAFSDPDSNTGSLVPNYWLNQMGEKSESFFRMTNYTFSHDNSILSVAKSLVDGAAVDGHKWEYYQVKNDPHTAQTRVIKKSNKFGSPPLVVSERLTIQFRKEIQAKLLSMHENIRGKEILNKLLIDRFVIPEEKWYQPIWQMKQDMTKPK